MALCAWARALDPVMGLDPMHSRGRSGRCPVRALYHLSRYIFLPLFPTVITLLPGLYNVEKRIERFVTDCNRNDTILREVPRQIWGGVRRGGIPKQQIFHFSNHTQSQLYNPSLLLKRLLDKTGEVGEYKDVPFDQCRVNLVGVRLILVLPLF